MASLEELRAVRIAKLERLKELGIDPYPVSSQRTDAVSVILEKFDALIADGFGVDTKQQKLTLAGRVRAMRGQGAISFVDLEDGTASVQLVLKVDSHIEYINAPEQVASMDGLALFREVTDIGDIIEVEGSLFVTQRGERSLLVSAWRMLAKTLRPLPEKWHGLADIEERSRRRYLDTLASAESKAKFVMRSRLVTELRRYLDGAGYLEVETPMLQPLAGGTNALPFKTHHNALDMELYLRIAPELYLKKLVVGGFDKVYEIGRNFRNEGIDATHNPEFTMLEFYEAYSDAERQMDFVERMVRDAVVNVTGKDVVTFSEQEINVSNKFTRASYAQLVSEKAGIDPRTASVDEVKAAAEKLDAPFAPGDSREKVIDIIYKKVVRPNIVQPTFITEYPVGMLPLAKRSPNDPNVVDAFQLLMGGIEVVKGFSELNDPIDQAERFKKEEENAQGGDTEAQPNDVEYVEALEYGLPPAGGVGIGIDRLAMLLTDSHNIRDVVLFPTMRPR